ncbi:hypothetical protein DSECCO2_66450 [anaerobic digester metagenome]|jgi:hypothetical protein
MYAPRTMFFPPAIAMTAPFQRGGEDRADFSPYKAGASLAKGVIFIHTAWTPHHPASCKRHGNGSSYSASSRRMRAAMARSWMASPVESKIVMASGDDRPFFPMTTSPRVPAIRAGS